MVTFMAKFLLYTSLLCHNDMLVKKKKKQGKRIFSTGSPKPGPSVTHQQQHVSAGEDHKVDMTISLHSDFSKSIPCISEPPKGGCGRCSKVPKGTAAVLPAPTAL